MSGGGSGSGSGTGGDASGDAAGAVGLGGMGVGNSFGGQVGNTGVAGVSGFGTPGPTGFGSSTAGIGGLGVGVADGGYGFGSPASSSDSFGGSVGPATANGNTGSAGFGSGGIGGVGNSGASTGQGGIGGGGVAAGGGSGVGTAGGSTGGSTGGNAGGVAGGGPGGMSPSQIAMHVNSPTQPYNVFNEAMLSQASGLGYGNPAIGYPAENNVASAPVGTVTTNPLGQLGQLGEAVAYSNAVKGGQSPAQAAQAMQNAPALTPAQIQSIMNPLGNVASLASPYGVTSPGLSAPGQYGQTASSSPTGIAANAPTALAEAIAAIHAAAPQSQQATVGSPSQTYGGNPLSAMLASNGLGWDQSGGRGNQNPSGASVSPSGRG